jgi:hypothetical protein
VPVHVRHEPAPACPTHRRTRRLDHAPPRRHPHRGSVEERGFDATRARRLRLPAQSANAGEQLTWRLLLCTRQRVEPRSPNEIRRRGEVRLGRLSETPSARITRQGPGSLASDPTACSPYRGGGFAVRRRPPLLDLDIVAAARALATTPRCRVSAEPCGRASRRAGRGDGLAPRQRCANSARTAGSSGPGTLIAAP